MLYRKLVSSKTITCIGSRADNVKYYVSADYMSQKGVLKGFNYKRYSIRTNIDMNFTDYMKVGTNSYIVSHNRDGTC